MRAILLSLVFALFSSVLCSQNTTVKTTKVSEISYNCARILASSNGKSIAERGIAYSLSANKDKAESYMKFGTGSFGGYSSELVDLIPETTYYVRAYALSNQIYFYGKELSFTTSKMPSPDVLTLSCSEITKNSARVQGRVSGPEILECGVCVSDVKDQEKNGNYQIVATKGFGNYSIKLKKLKSSTLYYARFYAKNNAGTSYGKLISFTTK